MRASRLLLRQMTEPTGVPLPICIPSSPLNTGILERVGVIATFLATFLATFPIFCEISERIFSRLRSNFTGFSPLCLCYFCYFHHGRGRPRAVGFCRFADLVHFPIRKPE